MASLDSLPGDQRAVLQLVLQRGRSYDEIAQLLSIDRAAVRERALSGLDALGPETGVVPESRALITDYLLGQLPPRVAENIRDRLAESPAERAWARVVAAELTPLARDSLPEIPSETSRRDAVPEPAGAAEPASTPGAAATPESDAIPQPAAPSQPVSADLSAIGQERPRSRMGGAIVLGIGALVAVIVIVILIIVLSSGGGSSNHSRTAASTSASSATTSTTTSGSTSATAKPVAQVNLVSPTGNKKLTGVAIVVKQGTSTGVVIRAQGVPANTTHNAYAVWLYNSPSDSHILGFVNPGVKANGVLQTAGLLPANAAHYKHLLVSLETTGKPRIPGQIVLQGALTLGG